MKSVRSDGRRNRNRHPTQLIRRRRHFVKWRAAQPSLADRLERLVRHRWTNAIEPGSPIATARRGEWRAAQLLGVQTMRHSLRRILPARQHACHRFARELVAESRLVAQLGVFPGVFVLRPFAVFARRLCVAMLTDSLAAPAPFRSIQTAL